MGGFSKYTGWSDQQFRTHVKVTLKKIALPEVLQTTKTSPTAAKDIQTTLINLKEECLRRYTCTSKIYQSIDKFHGKFTQSLPKETAYTLNKTSPKYYHKLNIIYENYKKDLYATQKSIHHVNALYGRGLNSLDREIKESESKYHNVSPKILQKVRELQKVQTALMNDPTYGKAFQAELNKNRGPLDKKYLHVKYATVRSLSLKSSWSEKMDSYKRKLQRINKNFNQRFMQNMSKLSTAKAGVSAGGAVATGGSTFIVFTYISVLNFLATLPQYYEDQRTQQSILKLRHKLERVNNLLSKNLKNAHSCEFRLSDQLYFNPLKKTTFIEFLGDDAIDYKQHITIYYGLWITYECLFWMYLYYDIFYTKNKNDSVSHVDITTKNEDILSYLRKDKDSPNSKRLITHIQRIHKFYLFIKQKYEAITVQDEAFYIYLSELAKDPVDLNRYHRYEPEPQHTQNLLEIIRRSNGQLNQLTDYIKFYGKLIDQTKNRLGPLLSELKTIETNIEIINKELEMVIEQID